MKMLLALLLAYTISDIAFDRAFQRQELARQTPAVMVCKFHPVITYGKFLKIRGYFEEGDCCTWLHGRSGRDPKCKSLW